jgi:TPP-dependent indolepyruvate ferredoxin oxidoreductase alpha subunit
MKNELIKLADHLDRKGLHTEADYLDVLIKRAQADNARALELAEEADAATESARRKRLNRPITDSEIRENAMELKQLQPQDCLGCTDEEWFQFAKNQALRFGYLDRPRKQDGPFRNIGNRTGDGPGRKLTEEDIKQSAEEWKDRKPGDCPGCTDEEWLELARDYAFREGDTKYFTLLDARDVREVSVETIRAGLEEFKKRNPWECEGCTDEEWFQAAKNYALRFGRVYRYTGN